MSDPPVLVEARGVGKKFKLYPTPNQRLLEWLSFGRSLRHTDHWALKGIDVTVRRGECLGVIGVNGSGKSTLLRILSGSLSATTGSVRTVGRVFALTELRTGFNPQLTGRQNIMLAGQMLDLEAEVAAHTDAIIEFADLGDFIEQPARIYSAGMFARLGFSLYAFLEPEVLMIDEVLGVGDAAFKRKSFDLMEEQINSGERAVIYVSHAMPTVQRLCTHVLWIHQGEPQMYGDPAEVITSYLEFAGQHLPGAVGAVASGAETLGETSGAPDTIPVSGLLVDQRGAAADTAATLSAVWIENRKGEVIEAGHAHLPFAICYAIRFHRSVAGPGYRLELTDERGAVIGVCRPEDFGLEVPDAEARHLQIVRCPVARGIAPGRYDVSVSCVSRDGGQVLNGTPACTLSVHGPGHHEAAYDLFLCPNLSGGPVAGEGAGTSA